jgi:hypothetical protein
LSVSKVGATQVAYVLLNFKFVIKSRTCLTVNALARHLVAARVKELKELQKSVDIEGDEATALNTFSTSSNLGRRDVYSAFVRQQNELQEDGGEGCTLTYSNLLSFYNLTKYVKSSKKRAREGDSGGESDHDAMVIDASGEEDASELDLEEEAAERVEEHDGAFDSASDIESTLLYFFFAHRISSLRKRACAISFSLSCIFHALVRSFFFYL